jgi:RNA polymerase sigma factor (sigma-70 family)
MPDGSPAVQISPCSSVEADGTIPRDADLLCRFVDGQDPDAFELLVRRHGPMVEGVCRRILGNQHDAEDAFQAAFLVLARKAAALRHPDRLANWLYGVAYRVARKARQKAALRDRRDRLVEALPSSASLLDFEWQELKSALDDELNLLPEKYRAPLVLCYLCGKTNIEAAELLGWPGGSISTRLARARDALRRRLNRRGLSLSAGLLALLLTNHALAAAPPVEVARVLAALAVLYVTKPAGPGGVSAEVEALVGEALGGRSSGFLKASVAVLIVLLLALLALPVVEESLGQSSPVPANGSGANPGARPRILPPDNCDADAFPCRAPRAGCCAAPAAEQPADPPAEKPADQPADPQADQPADEPAPP